MTLRRIAGFLILMVVAAAPSLAASPPPESTAAREEAAKLAKLPPVTPRAIDHSGRKQAGRGSYYAKHFAHRKTASGSRLDTNSNAAASKTLPFGTTAKVTNLSNGKSALVKVEDRGPFVRGRVVDVTPKVADELGLGKAGVTPVEVAPIAVPQRDGAVKLGAGAADASPQEVAAATETARAAAR